MGVYDQAARWATNTDPSPVVARLLRDQSMQLRFVELGESRTTPRPGGLDRTADRVFVLADEDDPGQPWLLVGSGTGSGFLLEDRGKYLVVTNRHVVENARTGVAIHFLLGKAASADERFTVAKEQTTVVGIHRSADLAVVDVSSAAEEIRKRKIAPVQLAPRGYRPSVGEHVFAIGHPGDGKEGILTRTLSDGIISAVGRRHESALFLQVTVPINPGNSGGPLFDDDGKVVGVNTFGIRKSSGREITLEALNFALESDFVHEVVAEPAEKSLDPKAIAAVLNPPPPPRPASLREAMEAKVKKFEGEGYRRNTSLNRVFRINARSHQVLAIRTRRPGEFAVTAVSQGARQVNLAIVNRAGKMMTSDSRATADPEVTFKVGGAVEFAVVVLNPSDTASIVAVAVLEK